MQRRISQHHHVRRAVTGVAVTATAALVITGCGGQGGSEDAAEVSTMDELIEAAQADGELTVYGAPPEPAFQAAVDGFSEKYGISVSSVRIVSGQIAARYPSEKEADAPTADAILMNYSSFFPQAVEDGIVTSIEDLDIPGYPFGLDEQFLKPEDGTATVGLQVRGITVNTDFIDPSEISSWEDILDPKYTGHIGIADPASAPVYIGHWYTIGEEMGGAEEYLTAVGEQLGDNQIFASGAPATAATGAGENWMFPMNIMGNTQLSIDEGAPLDFVVPDTTTADEMSILVNNEPANPNAARLFAAYMMSEEGAGVLAEGGGETSPYDTANMPENLITWPLEVADEEKDNVVAWLGS